MLLVLLSSVGATAISDALKINCSLQKLTMGWNNISDNGVTTIAKALKLTYHTSETFPLLLLELSP